MTNLPDKATVRRPTKTRNAAGGTTDVYAAVYTDLPCHAQARVLREIKEDDRGGGQVQSGVRWIVRFSFGTVINLDDLLDITEARTGHTYTLQVTSHLSPQSYGTAYGVQCIRVE